jgi:predicted Zn-dependent protease
LYEEVPHPPWLVSLQVKPLEKLTGPARLHLDAAQGWMYLQAWNEALQEIGQITDEFRHHFDVLESRYQLHILTNNWPLAEQTARTISELFPNDLFGWLNLALVMNELGRAHEARDLLLSVVDRFPNQYIVPYQIACYCCQAGCREEAKTWLSRAFALTDDKEVKTMALEDRELQPLWENIVRL